MNFLCTESYCRTTELLILLPLLGVLIGVTAYLIRRESKPKYTVTGYGVAHRTADSYMKDPKVQRQLEAMSDAN